MLGPFGFPSLIVMVPTAISTDSTRSVSCVHHGLGRKLVGLQGCCSPGLRAAGGRIS